MLRNIFQLYSRQIQFLKIFSQNHQEINDNNIDHKSATLHNQTIVKFKTSIEVQNVAQLDNSLLRNARPAAKELVSFTPHVSWTCR